MYRLQPTGVIRMPLNILDVVLCIVVGIVQWRTWDFVLNYSVCLIILWFLFCL